MNRRAIVAVAAQLSPLRRAPRSPHAAKPLKIGVMNDMSSVYSDYQGIGSVVAARLAVDDYSAKLGVPVEIVFADHQNKPDIGAGIARDWFDNQNVDVVMDLPNSAVALAVRRRRRAEEQGGDRLGRRLLGDDRPEMLAQFHPMDLRHLRARHGPRQGAGRAGRQDLVLHHRRLRLRQGSGGQLRRRGRSRGGKVLGEVRHPLNTAGFLVFPPAGAGVGRGCRRLRQRRRRSQQFLQAGRRIRPRRKSSASPASSSTSPISQRSASRRARTRRSAPASTGT